MTGVTSRKFRVYNLISSAWCSACSVSNYNMLCRINREKIELQSDRRRARTETFYHGEISYSTFQLKISHASDTCISACPISKWGSKCLLSCHWKIFLVTSHHAEPFDTKGRWGVVLCQAKFLMAACRVADGSVVQILIWTTYCTKNTTKHTPKQRQDINCLHTYFF